MTPAWMLTANCIWNSFRQSEKKHLILTGSKKSGKTTLLGKLLPHPLPGITTFAVPGEGVYLSENGTDIRRCIGIYNKDFTPPMQPNPDAFRAFGIPAIQRCISSDSAFVSMDEIGFLETSCPEYCDAVQQLFQKKQVLAVVRKQNLPFLNAILSRDDAFVIDLDAPFGNTGCVIMASGLSKRFGGNKLMADFHAEPLIAGVLSATKCLSNRVVVTRHRDVAEYCQKQNVPVVVHDLPNRNDTIRLGLDAVKNVERCLFCPSDQPLLSADTVMSLVLLGQALKDKVIRPAFENQPGAPILFPQKFFPDLYALPEKKGGTYFLKDHPEEIRLLPISDERELSDVDTKEALATLSQT